MIVAHFGSNRERYMKSTESEGSRGVEKMEKINRKANSE